MIRKPFDAQAEPNWTLFGSEGGLPNPRFDQWIKCWCDLESKSTFAQSASSDSMELMFGDSFTYCEGQEPDTLSWCGYEWSADGTCWTLEHGPESENHWWEIDDLLWGAFEECLFSARKPDGLIMSRGEIWEKLRGTSLLHPEDAAESMCEYWLIP